MKNPYLIVILLTTLLRAGSVSAQALDMMVTSPCLEIVPGSSSHTASLAFDVLTELGGHSLSSDEKASNFAEVRITLTKLDGAGILPMGTGAALFSWDYVSSEKTYVGRSKDVMLTEDNRYLIQLTNLSIANASQSEKFGFTALLLPPQDLLGSEAQDDSLALFQQAPLDVRFTATRQNRAAVLNAMVSQEAKTGTLEVERSSNGKNWSKIGEIDVNNATDITKTFDFRDLQPKKGQNLYRLKMTGQNGEATYSIERKVSFDDSVDEILYPNPLKTGERLNLLNSEVGQINKIRIFDSSGKQVYQSKAASQIDTSILTPGSYLVQLSYMDGTTSTHRVVKQ